MSGWMHRDSKGYIYMLDLENLCSHPESVNWGEPHTSVTALRDACVCMFAAIYRKLNLTNGNEGISTLHMCSSNSWSMQIDTMDPSLSNSTPMDLLNARDRLCLEREERVTARLQHRRQRDQEQRSEQAEVKQAGLDRLHVRRAAEQPTARLDQASQTASAPTNTEQRKAIGRQG